MGTMHLDRCGLVHVAEQGIGTRGQEALPANGAPRLDYLHASHGRIYGDAAVELQAPCIQREAPHIGLMNNALRTQLLETAAAYCAVKSISLSTLSHKIVNDGKVLPRLAAGGHDIQTGTFERFMAWFEENMPDAAIIPAGPYQL